jgi:hypothetical protein
MSRLHKLVATGLIAGLVATTIGPLSASADDRLQLQIQPSILKDLVAFKTPRPLLAYKNAETKNGFVYHNLTVTNWQQFSNALFASAPDLPPCGLNNNSSRTWVDIYDAATDQRLYGFCAFSQAQNMTQMWFAVPVGQPAPKAVYVVLNDRKLNKQYKSNAVNLVALQEDCISFNPAATTAENVNGRWKVVENGSHWMFDFDGDKASAVQSLNTIKHYGMTQSCFVGRPQPSFKYMLVNRTAPVGPMPGEDCIPFNPVNATVSYINNRWKIVDGNHWMFDFADNRAEAEQSLAVIQKYGFTQTCYVGRPNPNFSYLRK